MELTNVKTDKPIYSTIRNMDEGETEAFDLSRLSVVRTIASVAAAEQGKTFRCSVNRQNRTVEVYRQN